MVVSRQVPIPHCFIEQDTACYCSIEGLYTGGQGNADPNGGSEEQPRLNALAFIAYDNCNRAAVICLKVVLIALHIRGNQAASPLRQLLQQVLRAIVEGDGDSENRTHGCP